MKKVLGIALYVSLLFLVSFARATTLSEFLQLVSPEERQELLHDERYAPMRIECALWIWKQKNCAQLWQMVAGWYGGYAELSKQYRADSGQNMLNCAIAREKDEVAQSLGPHVVANL